MRCGAVFFLTSSSSSNSLNMLSMSINDLWMTLNRTRDVAFSLFHTDDEQNEHTTWCVCVCVGLPVVCAEPV